MAGIPVLKAREIERVLERLGFSQIRHKGSHRRYRHPDGRGKTVLFQAGRDVSPILLRQIIQDIRPAPGEFTRLL